jgi:hypothetical protein
VKVTGTLGTGLPEPSRSRTDNGAKLAEPPGGVTPTRLWTCVAEPRIDSFGLFTSGTGAGVAVVVVRVNATGAKVAPVTVIANVPPA